MIISYRGCGVLGIISVSSRLSSSLNNEIPAHKNTSQSLVYKGRGLSPNKPIFKIN